MTQESLPLFIPSLVALLAANESKKGIPLTEVEVIQIRDSAQVVMSPVDVYKKVSDERGYDDIDPELVWEEWKRVRLTLINSSAQQVDAPERFAPGDR